MLRPIVLLLKFEHCDVVLELEGNVLMKCVDELEGNVVLKCICYGFVMNPNHYFCKLGTVS